MKINKDQILTNLLRQYKQGKINETDLKNLLVDLGIMEPCTVIKTNKISMRQLKNMNKNIIIIIK